MERDTPTTLAPAARNASVTKLPRPPFAPVISVTSPSSGFMLLFLTLQKTTPRGTLDTCWQRLRCKSNQMANTGSMAGLPGRSSPRRQPVERRRHEDKVLLVLTLIIGAVVGLVVVLFILLTENLGARLYPASGAAWRRVLVPVFGALLTGFLLQRYFPNARGSGIPQTKAALFLSDGYIGFRTVLGKFGLCSVSLASGIALGREGPSVHVGAGIASVLGRRLRLSPASIKALVPAGAAAALAAAFNTPISAVLFSLEEVMGDMHAPVLGSVVISSATSWIVLHLILGDEPLFHVPSYELVNSVECGSPWPWTSPATDRWPRSFHSGGARCGIPESVLLRTGWTAQWDRSDA